MKRSALTLFRDSNPVVGDKVGSVTSKRLSSGRSDLTKSLAGFTLIEVIAVIVIVGILTAGFGAFFTKTVDLWDMLSTHNEVANQLRLGLSRMTRDIRLIKDHDSLTAATDTVLQFTDVNDVAKAYRYDNAGQQLFYQVNAGAENLMFSQLSAFHFSYYDSADADLGAAPALANIHRIGINATITSGGRSMDVGAEVFPRSFN